MTRRVRLGVAIAVGIIAAVGLGQAIKNPDTLIYVTYGPEETLDPAFAYDTASGEVIMQVYDNLVSWPYGIVDADENRYEEYSLDPAKLQPMLATDWWVSPSGRTYVFSIREGVKFHQGGILTPEDVEYTFERGCSRTATAAPSGCCLSP